MTAIRFDTVDSVQGNERPYVVVDMVIGKPVRESYALRDKNNEDDEVDGTEFIQGSTRGLSAYARDPRLCCALTRAKYGLVFFCKGPTVCAVLPGRDYVKRAIYQMYKDAKDRNVLAIDAREDSSPEPQLALSKLSPEQREARLRDELNIGLGILNPAF